MIKGSSFSQELLTNRVKTINSVDFKYLAKLLSEDILIYDFFGILKLNNPY